VVGEVIDTPKNPVLFESMPFESERAPSELPA
jgi:hypothetical protein